MKHKSHRRHTKSLKRKIKRMAAAAAVAGVAFVSSAFLPGLPATAHASALPDAGVQPDASIQQTVNSAKGQFNLQTESKVPLKKAIRIQAKAAEKQAAEQAANKAAEQAANKAAEQAADKAAEKAADKAAEKKAADKTAADKTADKAGDGDKTAEKAADQAGAEKTPNKQVQAKPATDKASPNAPENFQEVLNIKATAYAPGPHDNDQWGDKTYMGTTVRPGIIAVDPNIIPLGSKVYIEYPDGTGQYAVAEDTGGAIKGNRIDVAVNSVDKAYDFGIKNVKVYVVDKKA
ncbi:hypothetical protein SRRS_44280 [Sporomusa rhizae]|uniref:3D domain-containing protein n=1 Tax=Sporomusa rhizae TaxID=357999 RepID=UPI00352A4409